MRLCFGLILVLGVSASVASAEVGPLVHQAARPAAGRNFMTLRRDGERIALIEDGSGRLLTGAALAETTEVVVIGSDGDDTLTIDFTGGNPIPSGGVTFDGRDQVTREGDSLVLRGGSWHTVTYDYTNAHDGQIDLDGFVVRYRGLEPLANSGTATNVVFNLPTASANVARLDDNGVLGDNISRLESGSSTFETTDFTNPTGSLTINGGSIAGGDTIGVCCGFDVGSGPGQFNATLVVNAPGPVGNVTLSQDLPISGSLAFSAATIDLGGSVTTGGGQTYTGQVQNAQALTQTLASTGGGDISFSGTYGSGGRNLVVDTAGTTTFHGVQFVTDLSTDAPGTTTLAGGTMEGYGAQTIADPVTLTANTNFLTDVSASTVALTNTVAGAFSISIAGPGTVTLSGANTYSGGTAVNAGVLRVNNSSGSGTGSGAVTVASGGTLAGTGAIGGNVALQSGSAVAPGNGVGTLAVSGDVTWNSGATGAFELSSVDTTSDQVAITGALTKGSGTSFLFNFQATGHPAVYTLATFASTTFAASDFTYTNLAPGLAGTFAIVGGTSLTFTVGVTPVGLSRFAAE